MRWLVAGFMVLVGVAMVIGFMAYRQAAEECEGAGGTYEVVDHRPETH